MGRKGYKSARRAGEKLPRMCGFCWRRERPTPRGFTEEQAVLMSRYDDFNRMGCPYNQGKGQRRPMRADACGVFAIRSKESSFMFKLARHVICGGPLPRRKRDVHRSDRVGGTWSPAPTPDGL